MAYSDEVLADSPYGYWKLNEASGTTCADSSGNGRNMTYQGSPTYREAGPILTDSPTYGVKFSGANYNNVWTPNAWSSNEFALEVWAKFTTNSVAGMGIIGRAEALESSTGNPFVIYTKDGRIKGIWTNTGFVNNIVQSGTGMNDGNWHHVVLTRAGTTLSLYVDGSLVDSMFAGGSTLGARAFRIAGVSLDTVCKFDGTVAHGALYTASLSAERVAAHFNAALGGAMAAAAAVRAAATADLSVASGVLDATASVAASASGALGMAQALVADAITRAQATASMPTPGPGFGAWTRGMRPFVRYGRAVMFGYRAYYDDAGALTGVAQSVATASGDLGLTVIGLAGDAVVRVAVTGDLGVFVAEQMSGSAQVSITATGDLQTNEIQGTAPAKVTATGALGVQTPLSAEAVARAIAAGTPSVLVPLGGTAAVVEAATGALLAQSGLAGSAADVASASAAMVAAMAASGSAASRAAAVASLMVGSSLAGQAAAVGTVTGALGVGMDLDADAQARASAAATTGVSTDLSGQARVATEATGTLRDVAVVTGGITYAVNLSTGAATNLLNFDFERLATAHGGTLYGLKANVLYAIGGVSDPGSADIDVTLWLASQRISNHQHRLEKVYFVTRETDGLRVAPIYDEVKGTEYITVPINRDGMRVSKVNIGRNNRFHTVGLIVRNRNGGKLDLGGAELIVTEHHNRYK